MKIIPVMFALLLTWVACQNQTPVPTPTNETVCTPFTANGPFAIRYILIYVDEIFRSRTVTQDVTVTKQTVVAGATPRPPTGANYNIPGLVFQSPVSLEPMDQQTRQDLFRHAFNAQGIESGTNNTLGYAGCQPYQVILFYQPVVGTLDLSYSLLRTWERANCVQSASRGQIMYFPESLQTDVIPLDLMRLVYQAAWPGDARWECGAELRAWD